MLENEIHEPPHSKLDRTYSKMSLKNQSGNQDSKLGFEKWVGRKDKYEKAVKVLHQLNEERAVEEDSCFQVAVALASIDTYLKIGRTEDCDCKGICRNIDHAVTRQRKKCTCPAAKCSICNRCIGTEVGILTCGVKSILDKFKTENECYTIIARGIAEAGEGKEYNSVKVTSSDLRAAHDASQKCSIGMDSNGNPSQRPCNCPMRSLADVWVKWIKKHHSFEDVKITKEQARKFGGAAFSMMRHENEGQKDEAHYVKVKWSVPAKIQKGDTAKIAARRRLSKDEKLLNGVRSCVNFVYLPYFSCIPKCASRRGKRPNDKWWKGSNNEWKRH